MESYFYFEDTVRWGLWAKNPNHSAALLAQIIPIVAVCHAVSLKHVFVRNNILVGLFLLSTQFAFWWLLAKTLSRGGIIGAVAGIMIISCVLAKKIFFDNSKLWATWLSIQITIATAALFFSKAFNRFYAVTEQDPSAWNRLEIWKAALALIGGAPLHGWGRGYAGLSLMHWAQPVDDKALWGGPVNSYLNFALEYGLVALSALVSIVIISFLACFYCGTVKSLKVNFVAVCALGVLASFAVTSFFSSVWAIGYIILLPSLVAAVLLMLLVVHHRNEIFKIATFGALTSGLLGVALYKYSEKVNSERPVMVERTDDGAILIRSRKSASGLNLTILADNRSLGTYYGKELRRLMLADRNTAFSSILVYPPGVKPVNPVDGTTVAFGGRLRDLTEQRSPDQDLYLVNPNFWPPINFNHRISVVWICEADEFEVAERWRTYCKRGNIPFRIIDGVGGDITEKSGEVFSNLRNVAL